MYPNPSSEYMQELLFGIWTMVITSWAVIITGTVLGRYEELKHQLELAQEAAHAEDEEAELARATAAVARLTAPAGINDADLRLAEKLTDVAVPSRRSQPRVGLDMSLNQPRFLVRPSRGACGWCQELLLRLARKPLSKTAGDFNLCKS